MFDLLIGLGLAFFMLRIAERLSQRRPTPVPIAVMRQSPERGRR